MSFEIKKLTKRIIYQLYAGGNVNRAILASLRGATTLDSPRAQQVWPLMLGNLERNQLSRTGVPTATETAVYAALRLCAIQQQGRDAPVYDLEKTDDQPDDATNMNFFTKLAKMRSNPDNQDALDRRFQTLTAATNVDGAMHSLVSFVNIMKSSDKTVTIDYPRLAQDLYRFQMSFESANQVKLTWGQAYYQAVKQPTKVEETTNND